MSFCSVDCWSAIWPVTEPNCGRERKGVVRLVSAGSNANPEINLLVDGGAAGHGVECRLHHRVDRSLGVRITIVAPGLQHTKLQVCKRHEKMARSSRSSLPRSRWRMPGKCHHRSTVPRRRRLRQPCRSAVDPKNRRKPKVNKHDEHVKNEPSEPPTARTSIIRGTCTHGRRMQRERSTCRGRPGWGGLSLFFLIFCKTKNFFC